MYTISIDLRILPNNQDNLPQQINPISDKGGDHDRNHGKSVGSSLANMIGAETGVARKIKVKSLSTIVAAKDSSWAKTMTPPSSKRKINNNRPPVVPPEMDKATPSPFLRFEKVVPGWGNASKRTKRSSNADKLEELLAVSELERVKLSKRLHTTEAEKALAKERSNSLELQLQTQSVSHELQSIKKRTIDDTWKIFVEHEEFKLNFESQMEQLQIREKDLKKREANYYTETIELAHLRQINYLASVEMDKRFKRKKSDGNVLRLVEEQKKENEELHKKILDLQNKIDESQGLELQREQLRERVRSVNERKKKMDDLDKELEATEDVLDKLCMLNLSMTVNENKSNGELQDARRELIYGLSRIEAGYSTIGVKSMGSLDIKVFKKIAKDFYSCEDVPTKAKDLMEHCLSDIHDFDWLPFIFIGVKGSFEMVINEEDKRFKSIRDHFGEEAWQATITAMSELLEYNPGGRHPVPVLWNFEKGRKATLEEGATFILNKFTKELRESRKY